MKYETIWIYMINATDKQFRIILRNAIYITFSHINFITWKLCYHIDGIYLNDKSFRLWRINDDLIFTCIEVYSRLLITEYYRINENILMLANSTSSSNLAESIKITKSSITASFTVKSSTAFFKIWHQHLEHFFMRAVEHLSNDAKEI